MKKSMIILLTAILVLTTTSSANAASYSYPSDNFLWISLLIMAIVVIVFLVWIGAAIWVYKDAKKRGENAALWALIVIIGQFIGIILWFVLRDSLGKKQSAPDRICPNCGRGIPFDAKVCPYCAKRFEPEFIRS